MPRWQRQGSRWVRQPSTTTTTFFEMAPAPRAVAGDGDALGTPTTPPRNAGAMANAPADSPPAPPPAPVPARRYATRNVSPDASSGVQADPEGPQGAFDTSDSFAIHDDEEVEDEMIDELTQGDTTERLSFGFRSLPRETRQPPAPGFREHVREAARLDENMSLSRAIASRARLLATRDEDRDVELIRRRAATLLSDDQLRQVLRSNGNDVLASVLEIGGSVENLHQRLGGSSEYDVLEPREPDFYWSGMPVFSRMRQPRFPAAPLVPAPVARPVSALHNLVCKYIDHIWHKDIPDSDKAPMEYSCPLSLHAMLDPVECSDGKKYERAHIEAWRQSASFNGTSPLTRAELSPDQTECTALVNEMAEWACGNLGITGGDRDALAAALKQGSWAAEPKEAGAKPDADVDMEAGDNFTSETA